MFPDHVLINFKIVSGPNLKNKSKCIESVMVCDRDPAMLEPKKSEYSLKVKWLPFHIVALSVSVKQLFLLQWDNHGFFLQICPDITKSNINYSQTKNSP